MIYINAGKTRWIADDFKRHANADGFICRKFFNEREHYGYDLVHLTSGLKCLFIRKPGHIPQDWHEAALLAEKYSFCAEGFEFANRIADSALINGCRRFYIDEIGPLELMKQGFYGMLCRMLKSRTPELVISVRSSLVETVVELFGISGHREINIT